MTPRKSICWTIFWSLCAVGFGIGIYLNYGANLAAQFINVFMVEKLLSFDNLMVFLMIFTYFRVPDKDRRRVLNWGLIGAAVLRAICISAGIGVVQHLAWVLYVLGAVLIYSAYGMAFGDEEDDSIEGSKIVKFAEGLHVPAIMVWIVAIELSDIAFAIDSIPAGLSISQNLFIVYAANMFAILGLRSFYFAVQAIYGYLPQLKYGVSLVLAFIGIKMFLPLAGYKLDSYIALLVVLCILTINIIAILARRRYVARKVRGALQENLRLRVGEKTL